MTKSYQFSIGNLILQLRPDDVTPTLPTTLPYNAFAYALYHRSRQRVLDELQDHYDILYNAHQEHLQRLRKKSSIDYLVELRPLIPKATFDLICRLHALETLLLQFNCHQKTVVNYADEW